MRSTTAKRGRPSVFVASSSEGLDVAYAIQENLERDAETTVWPQGVFELSATNLTSLIKALARSDFGIFVFTPDDRVRIRKTIKSAVRDNVVFELGLFAGRLGPSRVFIVVPNRANDLRIPTDLLGVTPGTYDSRRRDGNLQAALGPFCNRVRHAMKQQRRVPKHRGHVVRKGGQRRISAGLTIHSAEYRV